MGPGWVQDGSQKGPGRVQMSPERVQMSPSRSPPGLLGALDPSSRTLGALPGLIQGTLVLSNSYPGSALASPDDRVLRAEEPGT